MKVLKAEIAMQQKEEENIILRKQLQEYEMRCSDNEAKMKSMQEILQKQMTSLQVTLLHFLQYIIILPIVKLTWMH